MAQSAEQVLLGDIGGTKARFALLVDGELGSIETFLVNNYPGIADAIEAFLARHRGRCRGHARVSCHSRPGSGRPLRYYQQWLARRRAAIVQGLRTGSRCD